MLINLIQLNLFLIDRNVGLVNIRLKPLCCSSVWIAVSEVKRLPQINNRVCLLLVMRISVSHLVLQKYTLI
jgi:hypothetical protein